ncbi:MAG: hypothetical protein K8T20_04990 [Planctomycetes bacterium]|nr:hypothetical protein [Planctomycetota bacterium]
MRTVTFADEDLCAWLNKTFVLAWFDVKPDSTVAGLAPLQHAYAAEEIAAYPEGGGGANIRTLVCNPDGVVRHALEGWWPADKFREECERGRACVAADSLEAAKAIRTKAAAGLETAAAAIEQQNPEEMRKPIRESKVARQAAALRLRATSFRIMDSAVGQSVLALTSEYFEDGEGKVMK